MKVTWIEEHSKAEVTAMLAGLSTAGALFFSAVAKRDRA